MSPLWMQKGLMRLVREDKESNWQIKALARKERTITPKVFFSTRDHTEVTQTIVELNLGTLEKSVVHFFSSMCIRTVVRKTLLPGSA